MFGEHLRALEAELAKARALVGTQTPEEGVPIGVRCMTPQIDGLVNNAIPIPCKANVTGIWLSLPQHKACYGLSLPAIRSSERRINET
ncbi:uncharacterized protein ANIA_11600 [Aspergillus nidulans FGSC A4]|uniref:Uncharacterized protein n=1 Tax=Emericella nidulans (strain FGSC A4 / ATCC 38163 / CBS 112.46 / NRRL 194 / M139) TaxID=227321 RepID=C8VDY8_EMENI|nr:hypothetical protein [Aspergillus nidulans FGSC A4]CBF80259.1 TPA: hypothetical protein ANIA_11600 [Aspergillus nidulans FGSC A4]